jgi:hypothetical protein
LNSVQICIETAGAKSAPAPQRHYRLSDGDVCRAHVFQMRNANDDTVALMRPFRPQLRDAGRARAQLRASSSSRDNTRPTARRSSPCVEPAIDDSSNTGRLLTF